MNLRGDLRIISDWIKPGSRVLDLGCGDGTLLVHLREQRDVSGYGLEIDDGNIIKCIRSGVNVVQRNLDDGLSDFDEDAFDYVIMTQTLQAVKYPDRLLREMLRVGREGIVTFPNFGNWVNRWQLVMQGKMPKSKNLPYEWYNTPNIHLCTFSDFESLCTELNISILERNVVDLDHQASIGTRLLPNLLGEIALYRFECSR